MAATKPSRLRTFLIPAAIGLELWICFLVLAITLQGSVMLALIAGAGVTLATALLLLMHSEQTRLGDLVLTDALTGLINHRGFHERLAQELRRARADGEPVSLVSLDLDNFKQINDTFGHPYGDEVLREIGGRIRETIRQTDSGARVGGEEFALILPGTSAETAFQIAERVRSSIAGMETRGSGLNCSAGIAVYPIDAEHGSTLCRLADGALYWAKRGGKGRTRRFDAEHVPLASTTRESAAIEALIEGEQTLRPVFQPVVALATGAVIGYEALARFPGSPRRAPAAWFAQAHACGLGPELEAAAIRAALEPLGRPIGTHLALNVSPSALSSEVVERALPDDLSDLVIEITEHEFIPSDDNLAALIERLRERGALIAIDDAGAGYSGLKQVMSLQPDIVKLDRDLTREIHADPARMALVESFVRFARRIEATVCAEGIESLDDLAVLSDLDVAWGQGFAFSPAVEPWAGVAAEATEVCRATLAQALESNTTRVRQIAAGDRRLEHVSARLAGARSRRDLGAALALIAAELHADKVCLSQVHEREGLVETLAENGRESGESVFPIDAYPLTAAVVREQRAVQVLAGDPETDMAEAELLLSLGHRSLLLVPVIHGGETLGIVEAYSDVERPWTRTEINRARIISNQFASVIDAFFRRDGLAVPIGTERGLV